MHSSRVLIHSRPEAEQRANGAEDAVEKAVITAELINAAGEEMEECLRAPPLLCPVSFFLQCLLDVSDMSPLFRVGFARVLIENREGVGLSKEEVVKGGTLGHE